MTLTELFSSESFNMAAEISLNPLSAATIWTDENPLKSRTFRSVLKKQKKTKKQSAICLYINY